MELQFSALGHLLFSAGALALPESSCFRMQLQLRIIGNDSVYAEAVLEFSELISRKFFGRLVFRKAHQELL